jgi:hypothetical protein
VLYHSSIEGETSDKIDSRNIIIKYQTVFALYAKESAARSAIKKLEGKELYSS